MAMFRAMSGPYQDHVRSKPGPCSGPCQAMDHASAMVRPYHEHVKTIPGPCQEHTRAMFRARKYMTVTSVKCSRHHFRSFGIILWPVDLSSSSPSHLPTGRSASVLAERARGVDGS